MPEKFQIPTYGLELEKVFTTNDGTPHAVDDRYFEGLTSLATNRGEESKLKVVGSALVGVANQSGEESLDNSFFLGESSTRPVTVDEGGLSALSNLVGKQVRDVVDVLSASDASLLNMSNHPLISITRANYEKYVAPKPVYDYMRNVRGWDHKVGINAKAQNSPSTGVSVEVAAEALNNVIGLGGVFIALYGNSPFEQAKVTPYKESRLMMWGDMFRSATFTSDYNLSQMPKRPFSGLADYFTWMFGDKTAMYFLVTADDGKPPKNEKGNVRFTRVDGDPPMLDFMNGELWNGTDMKTGEPTQVTPHIGHFAMNQFTHFSAARIRYGIHEGVEIDPKLVTSAIMAGDAPTESLFEDISDFFYIEGRDPGANFPDAFLRDVDERMADSVIMSPSALQAGIIANMGEASRLRRDIGWDTLRGLRDAAIKDGMEARFNDVTIRDIAAKVISIASDVLNPSDQWLLKYPSYVLSSGKNGAERALLRFDQLRGTDYERIKQITKERVAAL